jgi:hypothetical protein
MIGEFIVENHLKELESILTDKYFERLILYLTETKFGSITLVIQDGKIIQIEKSEKFRAN